VRFKSHGIELAGSIVLPPGEINAAVVHVHGSGAQKRNRDLARHFARAGIVALVYDKRGVGESGGAYEQNQTRMPTSRLPMPTR
jgi:alpha-beta hydrolase superfamily lysophospholipase